VRFHPVGRVTQLKTEIRQNGREAEFVVEREMNPDVDGIVKTIGAIPFLNVAKVYLQPKKKKKGEKKKKTGRAWERSRERRRETRGERPRKKRKNREGYGGDRSQRIGPKEDKRQRQKTKDTDKDTDTDTDTDKKQGYRIM
jgi:hypothetical protein